MNGANQAVSGGIGGFLAFFLLACALWLLMRNMNKRLQNVRYDEELEQARRTDEDDESGVISTPRRPGRTAQAGAARAARRQAQTVAVRDGEVAGAALDEPTTSGVPGVPGAPATH